MSKYLPGLLLLSILVSAAAFAKDYSMKVTEKGFEPSSLAVAANEDVTLNVTRTTDDTCAKAISVPSKKLKVKLPLNKETKVALGRLPKGEVKFACGMNMMGGVIIAK